MSKADEIRNRINQLTLVMNVEADVQRACVQAEIHPALAEVLMKMHASQIDMEKEIRTLRQTMVSIAQVIDMTSDNAVNVRNALVNLANNTGMSLGDLFAPAKEDDK